MGSRGVDDYRLQARLLRLAALVHAALLGKMLEDRSAASKHFGKTVCRLRPSWLQEFFSTCLSDLGWD